PFPPDARAYPSVNWSDEPSALSAFPIAIAAPDFPLRRNILSRASVWWSGEVARACRVRGAGEAHHKSGGNGVLANKRVPPATAGQRYSVAPHFPRILFGSQKNA